MSLGKFLPSSMPRFMTLRDNEGKSLVTAMLPPAGGKDASFRIIVVGKANADPYPQYVAAIKALGAHAGLPLDRERCFPYRR